jgi:hypothetical protein
LEPLRTLAIKDGHDFGVLFRAVERPAVWQAPDAGIAAAKDLSARLASTALRGAEVLSALPGATALYGATAQGQALLNRYGGQRRFVRVYDDNPALVGRCLAGAGQTPPIVRPDPDALADIDVVLICAYLHDEVIAQRLRALEFRGAILSVRPEFSPGGAATVRSLFSVAP